MDFDPGKVEALRADLFHYAIGVLWLVVMIILFMPDGAVAGAVIALDEIAASAPHLTMPPLATAFVLVILGVTVPYVVGEILESLTLAVMNWLLRVFRRLRRSPVPNAMSQAADVAITLDLGADTRGSRQMRLMYVDALHPRLGELLRRERRFAAFQVKALIPAALAIGGAVARSLPLDLPVPGRVTLGLLCGVAIFCPGFLQSVEALEEDEESLSGAVLIASKHTATV